MDIGHKVAIGILAAHVAALIFSADYRNVAFCALLADNEACEEVYGFKPYRERNSG